MSNQKFVRVTIRDLFLQTLGLYFKQELFEVWITLYSGNCILILLYQNNDIINLRYSLKKGCNINFLDSLLESDIDLVL